MSLLNQVLQDLDERSGPRAAASVRVAASSIRTDHIDEGLRWLGSQHFRVLGLGVLLVAVVLAALAFLPGRPDVHAPPTGVAVAAVDTVPQPIAAGGVEPASEPIGSEPDKSGAIQSVSPAEEESSGPAPIKRLRFTVYEVEPPAGFETQHGTAKAVASSPKSASKDLSTHEHKTFLPLKNVREPRPLRSTSKRNSRAAPVIANIRSAVSSAADPVAKIRHAIDQGDLLRAEQDLRSFLRGSPKNRVARELLIGLLLRTGRIAAAMVELDQGIQHHPRHETFYLIKSRLLAQSGQNEAALHLLEQAPMRGAGRVESLQMLAALNQQQGHFDIAAKRYRELVTLQPSSGAARVGLAISLDSLGDSTAIEHYRFALRLGGLPSAAGAYARQRIALLEPNDG